MSAVQRLVERKLAQKEKDKAKQVGSLTHFYFFTGLLLLTFTFHISHLATT